MRRILYTTRILSGILSVLILIGCTPPSVQTPESLSITFKVEFNGEECFFTGPAVVPAGYTNISFDNEGDRNFGPWVDYFLDDKTYEDFLNEIHLGPTVPHQEPDWVEHTFYYKKKEGVWTVNLDEPGEYGIFVGSYTPWQEFPCGEFHVGDAQAD